MRNIKMIAVLAMTLALAGVLAACGGSSVSSSAAASSEAASSEAVSAEAAASESAAAAESTEAEASESAADESDVPNVYTNEFFNVKFTLPEGWAFVDKDKLAEANSALASLSAGATVDMVAAPADSSAMVLIAIDEGSADTANQTAADHLATEVKSLTDSIEGGNGTYSYNTSDATIDFSDVRSLPAALTELDINGQKAYFFQGCEAKDGSFLDITIMAQSQDDATKITESFSMSAE